jgi:uncharacterized protein (TIGR02145 family)
VKIFIAFLSFCLTVLAQQTVADFDGNIYETITIGEQVWIKENLKSIHYTDGSLIPEVVAYNNDESLAAIYGLLYSWDAAMNGSTQPGIQGVCPCDWHVPTDEEWTILEDFLGGSGVAGGKMKEVGTDHWLPPNTGATNSSGFTGLPAGEFDAYFNPNKFWLLHTAAVFWTSTQTNQSQALERYLSHDNAACGRLPWYKVMKYSIRCIKDSPTEINNKEINHYEYKLNQNYPNPFNPITTIEYIISEPGIVLVKVFNVLGNDIATLVHENQSAGKHKVEWNAKGFPSGVYFFQLQVGKLETISGYSFSDIRKMILLK